MILFVGPVVLIMGSSRQGAASVYSWNSIQPHTPVIILLRCVCVMCCALLVFVFVDVVIVLAVVDVVAAISDN